MRRLADAERIRRLMQGLGSAARRSARVYLAGGATAVLEGWRESTIDVDMRVVPDTDEALFKAIPRLKEDLEINVELASPVDFVPLPAGWENRSPHIVTHGLLAFHHVDFVAQALAKLERGHGIDRADAAEMLARGLVTGDGLRAAITEAESEAHRYPAVDVVAWRAGIEATIKESGSWE